MNKPQELNENHLELSAHKGLIAVWLEKNKISWDLVYGWRICLVWTEIDSYKVWISAEWPDLTSAKQHLVSELFTIVKMGEIFPNHKNKINTKVFQGWFCDCHGDALHLAVSQKERKKREIDHGSKSGAPAILIYLRLVWLTHES